MPRHPTTDYEVRLSVERASGLVLVAVYGEEEEGQLRWIADTEMGPFDTALDLAQWLTRVLSPLLKLPAR